MNVFVAILVLPFLIIKELLVAILELTTIVAKTAREVNKDIQENGIKPDIEPRVINPQVKPYVAPKQQRVFVSPVVTQQRIALQAKVIEQPKISEYEIRMMYAKHRRELMQKLKNKESTHQEFIIEMEHNRNLEDLALAKFK
ncbi:hypothetical protein [Photobacterium aquimaris]|uniref:Uncharacterized protein n=1 Tax=Photobacterium aquimaris TaxID=512643 RepID=A0A1Y6L0S1_9GAMM|nr:hypothetical protein [Photobacterium aquimaris]SMY16228.1 hypothetical protein PAQU9191_01459 [Photobacterium aquimaris]